ncbi:MAG TPA: AGE family epimerase/isomerase, partial [bacterium]|nr:AGE family epimerase/isomerase [bacterium]
TNCDEDKMNRRSFLFSLSAANALPGLACSKRATTPPNAQQCFLPGMTYRQHRDELHDLLFKQYLPFWDHGGYDREYGGFICNLTPDGVPVDDEKYIWYQGRGLWVYSFLYSQFGKETTYLDIARRTRDFMVNRMYLGHGQWAEKVHRDGRLIKGVEADTDVYGWLFAAIGLVEYYRCTGDDKNLQLAVESIRAAHRAYEAPDYRKGTRWEGLRIQGHSMIFVHLLTLLLQYHPHDDLAGLWDLHLDHLMNRFYDSRYRIANEELAHDYRRLAAQEGRMFLGHSLEAQWMVMQAALLKKDDQLFERAKTHFKRYLEMGWDHCFDGWASEDYMVFSGPDRIQGADYSTKTMWAHTEILIGCMIVLEQSGESWAKEWYGRTWEYVKKAFCRGIGAWEQAVNRYGEPQTREKWGIHPMRRCNYHQPRFLMMNIKSLDRMMQR